MRMSLETPTESLCLAQPLDELPRGRVEQFGVGACQLIGISALGIRSGTGVDIERGIGLQQGYYARDLLADFVDDSLGDLSDRGALRFRLQEDDEKTHRRGQQIALKSRRGDDLIARRARPWKSPSTAFDRPAFGRERFPPRRDKRPDHSRYRRRGGIPWGSTTNSQIVPPRLSSQIKRAKPLRPIIHCNERL